MSINKNKIIPYDKKQKFQIGDICKIIHTDNTFRYPKLKDEDDWKVGLYVIITGSYWQLYGSNCFYIVTENENGFEFEPLKNLSDYSVIVPRNLNPQCYDKEGNWNYGGLWTYIHKNDNFGWAWVNNCCLEFIRKPNEEELNIAINKFYMNLKYNNNKDNKNKIWYIDNKGN